MTRCAQSVTLNDIVNNPVRRMMAGAQYAALRKGPLTIAAGTSGAFFKTSPRLASPDIQIHFLPFSTDKMGEKLHAQSGFTASVCQLRPESRGSLRSRAPILRCRRKSASTISRPKPIAGLHRRHQDPAQDSGRAGAEALLRRRGRSRREGRERRDCWTSAAAPAVRSIIRPRPAGWATIRSPCRQRLRVRGIEGLRVVEPPSCRT